MSIEARANTVSV